MTNGVPSPNSEHAISIREWFQENGYPPLTEEQRRAVVLFGRVEHKVTSS